MGFNYTILSDSLRETADFTIAWFMENFGIPRRAIRVESEFHPNVELRPTFVIQTSDHDIICIEVSDTLYANHLNASVLACVHDGIPVKLYVSVNRDSGDPNYAANLRAAKKAGVGIIEMNGSVGSMAQEALSLSLHGLTPIDIKAFPNKYRQALTHAEHTFRNGAPEKACSLIYDEIEHLFRMIAKKTSEKGWWAKPPNMKLDTDPWARVITEWDRNVQRPVMNCPLLNSTLASRIHGITPSRNSSGHKPKNEAELRKRNRQLRTRFEEGVNIFQDLVEGAKPLRL